MYVENLEWIIEMCSNTNSYNFAMTVISQDDHLTAGAWAAFS